MAFDPTSPKRERATPAGDRRSPLPLDPCHPGLRPGDLRSVDDLADQILATPGIEGVTFSGGEPFQQARALAALAARVPAAGLIEAELPAGDTTVQVEGYNGGAVPACWLTVSFQ